MGWGSWVGSGPGRTPRTAAVMALAGGGAGEDGGRLGAELIVQDAKALISVPIFAIGLTRPQSTATPNPAIAWLMRSSRRGH